MHQFRTLLLATSALLPLGLAIAFANPQGPQVVGGSATVQGQGTPTVTVTQTTDKAIINWNTFNIGTGEKTNIFMPGSSSVQLDRVTGGLGPSQILGSLWSNGKVFLVNPDGILFGAGAKVDTGSFLATTNGIANADFMAGRYNFLVPGNPSASIVNQGTITAQSGGFAALVAPGVRNSGTITATLGTVSLASGNSFTLDFYGDKLITLGVNDSIASTVKDVTTGQPLNSLVSNDGNLSANGGRVELTAAAARQVVDSVINTIGVIEANSIGSNNGMIVLSAATALSKPAGAPTQTVKVSGTLSAAGKTAATKGGTIQVTGENIAVTGATIDASGTAGGGKVLIGGDVGGGSPSATVATIAQAQLQPYAVPTASNVIVDAATTINASATVAGDGGKVVVWSDGTTSFNGTILATGGALGGNGGFVETSGHEQLNFTGARIDTSAPNGQSGLWLLDPASLLVDLTADSATIATNLATTDITLQTTVSGATGLGTTTAPGAGNGDIFVNSGVSWSSTHTLTLDAYHSIAINAGLTVNGAGHLVLVTNDGGSNGTLSFGSGGSATFNGTAGQSLTINTAPYTLLYSMSDVQNMSLTGKSALANNLSTGSPNWTPIGPSFGPGFDFRGTFEGLGNTISNVTIAPTNSIDKLGLFGIIQAGGVVENLRLTNFNIQANPNLGTGPGVGFQSIGTLAGYNAGTVRNVTATGVINGGAISGVMAGGLVGQNGFFAFPTVTGGTIGLSSAAVNVTLGNGVGCSGNSCNNSRTNLAGGLVGNNPGMIAGSSASGAIVVGSDSQAGGLVGVNQIPPGATSFPQPTIFQSFATGNVSSAGFNVGLGGLVGNNGPGALIAKSYAIGSVTASLALTANIGLDCSTSNCQYESVGGLVGQNSGTINGTALPPLASTSSHSTPCGTGYTCASGPVSVGSGGQGGGLAGFNDGIIEYAFATGAVTGAAGFSSLGTDGNSTSLGGLAGANSGLIQFSYATGAVGNPLGFADLQAGGLVADNNGTIKNSFATGNVIAGDNSQAGGLTSSSGPWNNSSCGGCTPDGAAYFNTALIDSSQATGNIIVGVASLAGGLSGDVNGTAINSTASGSVTGGGNSILGGLVAFTDPNGTITNSSTSITSTVTSTGANSWVGGFIGGNAGTINTSHASGAVNGTSESLLGGFAGLNIGTIINSTAAATSTVNGTGTNNYVGGFVGANFGTIDPSTAAGAVTGGANNFVGGFAGTNASLANTTGLSIPGSSFPTGTISPTSLATGTATGGANSTVDPQIGTTNPTTMPTNPSAVLGCNNGALCAFLQGGLILASGGSTDVTPPPPVTWINPPTNSITTPAPILASLTPPSSPTEAPTTGAGSYANATPGTPGFIPPPLPGRTVPGPNGETLSSIPPVGEKRYDQKHVLLQLGLNIPNAEIAQIVQQLGLQIVSSYTLATLDRKVIVLELPPGMSVREAIQKLEANRLVSVAAPDYHFKLTQAPSATRKGDPAQYSLGKLQLAQVHMIATGKGIVIAVIDSEIDKRHIELQGTIREELDAVGVNEPLQSHGTEMAGAIVSHDRLLGVAPDAKILAVRAFGEANSTSQGTTLSILKGLEWAQSQGARIINMSFAGPRDPSLERAFKAAHDKGVVLIAAAGNAGPKSPPLYPAADPNVIAVTATDSHNHLFRGANQGPQLSVAAPGVDIIAPAPAGGYQLSTGTSIATAQVSGVVALMLERDPTLKPNDVRKILESTAINLGPPGKNGQFGWGLVNPPKALEAVAAQMKSSDASSKNR